MGAPLSHTLSKEERLCGRNAVSALLAKGRYGVAGCLKYCFLQDNGLAFSRILISVPKRSFKRAVKRNLLIDGSGIEHLGNILYLKHGLSAPFLPFPLRPGIHARTVRRSLRRQ